MIGSIEYTDLEVEVVSVHHWSASGFRLQVQDVSLQDYVLFGEGSLYGESAPDVSSSVIVSGSGHVNPRTEERHIFVQTMTDAP